MCNQRYCSNIFLLNNFYYQYSVQFILYFSFNNFMHKHTNSTNLRIYTYILYIHIYIFHFYLFITLSHFINYANKTSIFFWRFPFFSCNLNATMSKIRCRFVCWRFFFNILLLLFLLQQNHSSSFLHKP